MKLFYSILTTLGIALSAHGDTFETQIEQTSPNKGDFGEYRIWLPSNIHPDRILIVVWGANQCSLGIVEDPTWQKLASSLDCALLAGFYLPQGSSNRWDHAAEGSGATLLEAIRKLALRSGETQLADAPIFLVGDSQGGQFAFNFASWQPARTLGFISLKGGQHDDDAIRNAVGVPGLFVAGEADAPFRILNIKSVFSKGRALSAPWCLAIDPGGNHSPDRCGPIVRSFLQALSLQGRKYGGTPAKPDFTLSKEDISSRSWFPNSAFKNDWSKFQSGTLTATSSPLSFKSISPLVPAAVIPASEDLGIIESGQKSQPFSLNVSPTGDAQWDDVSVLDCPYLSGKRVVKISPSRFTVNANLNASALPLGGFSEVIPLRFSLRGSRILGGLNIPLTGVVTGDVVASPSLILLTTQSARINPVHLIITSKTKHQVKLLSYQAPQGVRIDTDPLAETPLQLTVSFSTFSEQSLDIPSGSITLHLKTYKEWTLRIPYISSFAK